MIFILFFFTNLAWAQAPLMGVMSGERFARLGCPEFGSCEIRLSLPGRDGGLELVMVYPPAPARAWKKNWLYPCRVQGSGKSYFKEALLQKGECQKLFFEGLTWMAKVSTGSDVNSKNLSNEKSQTLPSAVGSNDDNSEVSIISISPDPSWERARWQPILRQRVRQKMRGIWNGVCVTNSAEEKLSFPDWLISALRHVGISLDCMQKNGNFLKNNFPFEVSPGDP